MAELVDSKNSLIGHTTGRGTGKHSVSVETDSGRPLIRGVREAVLIVTTAVALYFFLSLLTHHGNDPGWSHSGPVSHVMNEGGIVGAWVADVLLYLFGYLGFLFPLSIAGVGWLVYHGIRLDTGQIDVFVMSVRTSGFVLTLGAGCGLASLHFIGDGMPLDAGGVFGDVVGNGTAAALGLLGGTLALLAGFMTGISLLTGVSWLSIVDVTGRYTLNVMTLGAQLLGRGVLEGWSMLRSRLLLRRERQSVGVAALNPALTSSGVLGAVAALVMSPLKRGVRTQTPLGTGSVSSPSIDGFGVDGAGFGAAEHASTARKRPVSKPRIEPALDTPKPSEQAQKERAEKLQTQLFDSAPSGEMLPPIRLLDEISDSRHQISAESLDAMSRQVELKLADFGIEVEVVEVHPGPVVTRFELQLAPGLKVSKISALAKDLARSLSTISVRIVEVIPGKPTIGLEIPNEHRELVQLSEILGSKEYGDKGGVLSLALGKDIGGHPAVVNLGRMPHLLVAGTTGSGKSVAVNAMILSLLYKSRPRDVRMIMIDPKMLELSIYDGIPHLLTPVVTDMAQASNALRWCCVEMDRRYRLMSAMGVRNLVGLNRKMEEAQRRGEPLCDPFFTPMTDGEAPPELQPLPRIVVVVDELADLMMVTKKKCEELIARLAQKARAAGIHLILATQRPSVDVITGLIKANIPSRIAFQVSSKIDSRTIIDQMGAEQLLGHGDMLYLGPGMSQPTRVHGAFVDDHEVHQVADFLRAQGEPEYIESILTGGELDVDDAFGDTPSIGAGAEDDPFYDQAVRIVTETRRASISGVQRRLKIGYNRAARMLEQMEATGVVGALQSNGSREVLAPPPPR